MINIDIFGIKEEYPSRDGGCGSANGCNNYITIGEQYNNLKEFLKKRRMLNNVNLNFIDIREIEKDEFVEVKKMLQVGYSMPYTFINGKLRFFCTIPKEEVLSEIIDFLY